MKVVIGLGNPGLQYRETRHNIGFMVIDALAKKENICIDKGKFKGLIGEGNINGQKILLVKPQTFMNLSGETVSQVLHWYKVTAEDIIVIYDDMSLAVGQLRFRPKGSAGGHNGIKSMIQQLNTENFARLKIGIDRPLFGDVTGFVLGKFNQEEREIIDKTIERATDALYTYLKDGIIGAMNKFN